MGHRVLLVDDDPNMLSALSRALRKEPYTILTAASAEEAGRIMDSQPVDLIVCDEQMPGMSGTEFLSQVAVRHPSVIRIVLTGHPSLSAAVRAINQGKVFRFLTKPCNEIELALTIRQALEQKQQAGQPGQPPDAGDCAPTLAERARMLRRLRG